MSEEDIRKMCNDIYEGEEWQPMIDLIQSKDKEIERLHSIIKEVREYIKENTINNTFYLDFNGEVKELLEILDKDKNNGRYRKRK